VRRLPDPFQVCGDFLYLLVNAPYSMPQYFWTNHDPGARPKALRSIATGSRHNIPISPTTRQGSAPSLGKPLLASPNFLPIIPNKFAKVEVTAIEGLRTSKRAELVEGVGFAVNRMELNVTA
jgi:hypothetical protein